MYHTLQQHLARQSIHRLCTSIF